MKQITIFILCIAAGYTLLSCEYQTKNENERLMKQASAIVEEHPDSALVLLDSVNTAILNERQNHEFALMQVQARDNAGWESPSDTSMLSVKDYFIAKGNLEKAALACFYSGKSMVAYGYGCSELKYYLDALHFVGQTDNFLLKGRIQNNIGYLHYSKRAYEDANVWYRRALESFRSAGNQPEKEVIELLSIGATFLYENKNDSARLYYDEALRIAQQQNDIILQASIYQGSSVVHLELKQFDQAISNSLKALSIITNKSGEMSTLLNITLAFAYKGIEKIDSAIYCLDRATFLYEKQVDKNKQDMANILEARYLIDKKREQHAKALKYHEEYFEILTSTIEDQDRKSLLETQKKYNLGVIQNMNNRLIIEKQRIYFGATAIFALLAAMLCFINHKRKKFKKAFEQAQRDALIYKNMCSEHELGKNKLRDTLLQHMGISRDVALLDQCKKMDKAELIRKINVLTAKYNVYTFMEAIYQIKPNLQKRLKEKFPTLEDDEVCICCMILFDFDNDSISLVIKNKINTIQQKQTNIRHKLNIDTRGKIKVYLEQNLEGV